MKKFATILIPTMGRPQLIKHTFEGLKNQHYKNFELLLVLSTKNYETINLVNQYKKYFDIRIHFQKRKGLMEAYNEGFDNALGDVIICTDDDAIPNPDWISQHLITYEKFDVSGISGEVLPTYLKDGVIKPLKKSEVIPLWKERKILQIIGAKIWNRPLEGLEQHLAYISKSGYIKYNKYLDYNKLINSLLCMGVNMSILRSAIKNYRIPTTFFKRGLNWEQVIGLHLFRKGHRMVFNPQAKVYHILHGETMSRYLNTNTISIAYIERELIFYYLLLCTENVSIKYHIIDFMFHFFVNLKKMSFNPKYQLSILRGMLFGNIIGLKWIVSKRFGGSYIPIQERIFK